ncbi:MAG: triose-phosphate isomerase [Thermodesulfobacteriota bacterium]
MNRKPLVAANWKMYKTLPEAVDTAREMAACIAADSADVLIAPPFVCLSAVHDVVRPTAIALGAQNLFWEKEGAFTGEVSADMLRSVGCRYVLIGHSERRQYFGETDETVCRKIRAAVEAGLIPVFCIGETESERDAGQTFAVLRTQLQGGLAGMDPTRLSDLVIAYEPVWAIGTGRTASTGQIQEAHAHVRGILAEITNKGLANSVRILYGGSVKPGNAKEILGLPDVDGALVGGASLQAASFAAIVGACVA